ncbi:MAG: hypothetical protein ACREXY_04130 [Gammaproteobacteria bacterium]
MLITKYENHRSPDGESAGMSPEVPTYSLRETPDVLKHEDPLENAGGADTTLERLADTNFRYSADAD